MSMQQERKSRCRRQIMRLATDKTPDEKQLKRMTSFTLFLNRHEVFCYPNHAEVRLSVVSSLQGYNIRGGWGRHQISA